MTISWHVICHINSYHQIGICFLHNVTATTITWHILLKIIYFCKIVVLPSLWSAKLSSRPYIREMFESACNHIGNKVAPYDSKFFTSYERFIGIANSLVNNQLSEKKSCLLWDLGHFGPLSRVARNNASTTHHIHSRAGHYLTWCGFLD